MNEKKMMKAKGEMIKQDTKSIFYTWGGQLSTSSKSLILRRDPENMRTKQRQKRHNSWCPAMSAPPLFVGVWCVFYFAQGCLRGVSDALLKFEPVLWSATTAAPLLWDAPVYVCLRCVPLLFCRTSHAHREHMKSWRCRTCIWDVYTWHGCPCANQITSGTSHCTFFS